MSELDIGRVVTASLTDVGRVRAGNEDHCGEFRHGAGHRLLVVADGMGGHRGGATASRLAVETIGEAFESSTGEFPAGLEQALLTANQRVFETAREDPELRGMGTTVVCLLLAPDGSGWVAHIGDSRAYRLHEGRIAPLTADHSVVGAMVRQGLISAEEAEVHPRRNEILRSVGIEAVVQPEIRAVDLAGGDQYLLCSDGLTGMVTDAEIELILHRELPESAARSLVDNANERGGTDNITVQIAAIPDDAIRTTAPAAPSSPSAPAANPGGTRTLPTAPTAATGSPARHSLLEPRCCWSGCSSEREALGAGGAAGRWRRRRPRRGKRPQARARRRSGWGDRRAYRSPSRRSADRHPRGRC
ncbi:MAG: Stp1/IreP family PP2C-type Ser/Thr phosphatase [Deltaproteobacteria bacterium]|nr:Stp1/IreP family PP2C-type Ser/Thr phosphatase [Deltaproteobacteria bacterium]